MQSGGVVLGFAWHIAQQWCNSSIIMVSFSVWKLKMKIPLSHHTKGILHDKIKGYNKKNFNCPQKQVYYKIKSYQ